MKHSTPFLGSILRLGLIYSVYELFTSSGGAGIGNFIDGLCYTSLILFFTSLIIIVIDFRNLKKHGVTFLFLLLGLPVTAGSLHNLYFYRTPDSKAKYPRPVN